jgi:hypothetical protein
LSDALREVLGSIRARGSSPTPARGPPRARDGVSPGRCDGASRHGRQIRRSGKGLGPVSFPIRLTYVLARLPDHPARRATDRREDRHARPATGEQIGTALARCPFVGRSRLKARVRPMMAGKQKTPFREAAVKPSSRHV